MKLRLLKDRHSLLWLFLWVKDYIHLFVFYLLSFSLGFVFIRYPDVRALFSGANDTEPKKRNGGESKRGILSRLGGCIRNSVKLSEEGIRLYVQLDRWNIWIPAGEWDTALEFWTYPSSKEPVTSSSIVNLPPCSSKRDCPFPPKTGPDFNARISGGMSSRGRKKKWKKKVFGKTG